MLAAGTYGEVKLWDVATQTQIQTLSGHKGRASVAFSLDGATLAG